MATRYVAKTDFFCADKQGRRRSFKAKHVRDDGTVGYLPDEVKFLYRDHLSMFRKVEAHPVEQATAAPGERRNVSSPDDGVMCDECGGEFKTAAALGSHMRVHDDS